MFNLPSRYNPPCARLRFKLVAALSGFQCGFFDGLTLQFDLFGLPVGLSLSRGGVSAFGMLGIWGHRTERKKLYDFLN